MYVLLLLITIYVLAPLEHKVQVQSASRTMRYRHSTNIKHLNSGTIPSSRHSYEFHRPHICAGCRSDSRIQVTMQYSTALNYSKFTALARALLTTATEV
jgi:hypothetical protein